MGTVVDATPWASRHAPLQGIQRAREQRGRLAVAVVSAGWCVITARRMVMAVCGVRGQRGLRQWAPVMRPRCRTVATRQCSEAPRLPRTPRPTRARECQPLRHTATGQGAKSRGRCACPEVLLARQATAGCQVSKEIDVTPDTRRLLKPRYTCGASLLPLARSRSSNNADDGAVACCSAAPASP